MRLRGHQLPFDPIRKLRTQQHVIADLSYNFLERKVLERGHCMTKTLMTYRNLFTLLTDLGFREQPGNELQDSPRVFVHAETDTIMLFRRANNAPVSAADILSTEVRLHANKISSQPLETLFQQMAVRQ